MNKFFIETTNLYLYAQLFDITLVECLSFALIIFIIGIFGIIFNRNNLIVLLMAIELMLLGISLNFIFFSIFLGDSLGYIYALLILALAAAETSLGLAFLVLYFRLTHKISLVALKNLKG